MDALLLALARIADAAGALIRGIYATDFTVQWKQPKDPVTEADRQANELICEALARELPGVPVVAEESDPARFAGYRDTPQAFFVDPLDGTREFVEKNDQFAVMIGLADGGRAVAGAVCIPMEGTTFIGAPGHGAWRLTASNVREPIRVSTTTVLAHAQLLISRSHRTAAIERAAAHLGVRGVLPVGSAGLKGVRVAEGAADLYVAPRHGGKRWDTCATDALVRAAGGGFSDIEGHPIDYRGTSLDNDRGVIATNGLLHDAVRELLASAPQP